MNTYTVNLKLSTQPITNEHFTQLCALNPELRLETNSKGELIIMSPGSSFFHKVRSPERITEKLTRVKTVNLAELATGFRSNAKTESSYKRLQRY